MDQLKQLREQLAKTIDWNEAHADFSAAVAHMPGDQKGSVPEGFAHSPWQLLEHIRIALWDIVEFCRDARHKSPDWPEGYWPRTAAPKDKAAWEQSVASVKQYVEELRELIKDPERDLFAPLPHGSGQTLLREALLAADHNAYHVGQLVLTRKALGAWKG